MGNALKKGAKEGFKMVSEMTKPRPKKGTKTLPEKLVHNGKVYDKNALDGFYDAAAEIAKDPAICIEKYANLTYMTINCRKTL